MVNADSWWNGLSRDRMKAVMELVLDAMSDDYVTVEIIVKTINEWDDGADRTSWASGGRPRSRAPRLSGLAGTDPRGVRAGVRVRWVQRLAGRGVYLGSAC